MERFIGVVKAIIWGTVWIRRFAPKTVTDHFAKKSGICGVKLFALLLCQCPVLTCVGEAATNKTIQKFNTGFYGNIEIKKQIALLEELAFGILDTIIDFGPTGAGFSGRNLSA